jgi:hypothetical protein
MAFPLPAPSHPSRFLRAWRLLFSRLTAGHHMHLGYASVIDIALSSRYYLYCQHTRTVHIFASYALKN